MPMLMATILGASILGVPSLGVPMLVATMFGAAILGVPTLGVPIRGMGHCFLQESPHITIEKAKHPTVT
jgi:hypothetical protein